MELLGASKMMTFYIIGVAITLLFLLSFLAWAFVNEKYFNTLDVLVSVITTFLLSLLSWIFIYFVVMMLIFEGVKKMKIEEKRKEDDQKKEND